MGNSHATHQNILSMCWFAQCFCCVFFDCFCWCWCVVVVCVDLFCHALCELGLYILWYWHRKLHPTQEIITCETFGILFFPALLSLILAKAWEQADEISLCNAHSNMSHTLVFFYTEDFHSINIYRNDQFFVICLSGPLILLSRFVPHAAYL